MLVHICCSVDSHYFLKKLREAHPGEKLVGFFYNPNIHPKAEHDLRLSDVRRSCDMLDIPLLVGEYDTEQWRAGVRGLEHEPEKGERCVKCFDIRLLKTAQKAQEIGQKRFTTTLLASPLKEQQRLYKEGDAIAHERGLEFVKIDVRSGGGTQAQMELAKADNLYRQNYCGCEFALRQQREKQEKFVLEFVSNVGRQIQPGSNEHRISVFEERNYCEKEGKNFVLFKQKMLVWRCLRALISQNEFGKKIVLSSYILANSAKKNVAKSGKIMWILREIGGKKVRCGYPSKDDSIFLDLAGANALLGAGYKSVKEMVKNPPLFDAELALRTAIAGFNSINPIIILDSTIENQVSIFIDVLFQEEAVFQVAY